VFRDGERSDFDGVVARFFRVAARIVERPTLEYFIADAEFHGSQTKRTFRRDTTTPAHDLEIFTNCDPLIVQNCPRRRVAGFSAFAKFRGKRGKLAGVRVGRQGQHRLELRIETTRVSVCMGHA
jgi:hypothetical protein